MFVCSWRYMVLSLTAVSAGCAPPPKVVSFPRVEQVPAAQARSTEPWTTGKETNAAFELAKECSREIIRSQIQDYNFSIDEIVDNSWTKCNDKWIAYVKLFNLEMKENRKIPVSIEDDIESTKRDINFSNKLRIVNLRRQIDLNKNFQEKENTINIKPRRSGEFNI